MGNKVCERADSARTPRHCQTLEWREVRNKVGARLGKQTAIYKIITKTATKPKEWPSTEAQNNLDSIEFCVNLQATNYKICKNEILGIFSVFCMASCPPSNNYNANTDHHKHWNLSTVLVKPWKCCVCQNEVILQPVQWNSEADCWLKKLPVEFKGWTSL